jgi:hypothetical protein
MVIAYCSGCPVLSAHLLFLFPLSSTLFFSLSSLFLLTVFSLIVVPGREQWLSGLVCLLTHGLLQSFILRLKRKKSMSEYGRKRDDQNGCSSSISETSKRRVNENLGQSVDFGPGGVRDLIPHHLDEYTTAGAIPGGPLRDNCVST